MTSNFRRLIGLLPMASLLAAVPCAWLVSTAHAEERKFVVILADPPKDHPGAAVPLPNRSEVNDYYFDKTKNGQNGGPRIDSFAEWWEEVSYGNVTVSGNTYGWVSLPWPTSPPGFDGQTSFGSRGVIPHVELQGGFNAEPGSGEDFSPFSTMYDYDLDGVGEDPRYANFAPVPGPAVPGLFIFDMDRYGLPLFIPGERFVDLNGNRVYDAGVREWAIDKNGNGFIDVDPPGIPDAERRYNARSYAELVRANLNFPPPDQQNGQITFAGWANETEWFDSNRDGRWNGDGFASPVFQAFFPTPNGSVQFVCWWGDWGATEIFVEDPENPDQIGQRAENEGGSNQPASLWRYISLVNDNRGDNSQRNGVTYFDQQWNNNYDFPEPFEDYMRRWDGNTTWIPVDEQYIRNNYPGNADAIIARIGNGRYDGPNAWNNVGNVANSSKGMPYAAILEAPAEAGEQQLRQSYITPEPAWYNEMWEERYGTAAPPWNPSIPYVRLMDPTIPRPRPRGAGADWSIGIPFAPNGGGPLNDGREVYGVDFGDLLQPQTMPILPNPNDPRDGFYDGRREYDDMPSSIYHSGGDNDLGEVTSPSGNRRWGQDVGGGPSTPTPDGIIPACGPMAFNVHGDGGYDAGNMLNLEVLTWRTNGQSLADRLIDFDGDGVPDFVWYHRDTNLDGLMDLGERPGDAGQYGIPNATNEYSNYGVDMNPGTPPNGGPEGEYPYSRRRLIEDCVAALDESVDWDDFLGGPPPFGNVISGVILLPAGTSIGMFFLPAASWDQPIRTRDVINPNGFGTGRYVPIPFFNGLGIGLNDGAGEGDAFSVGNYHLSFSCHEYGHSWEGFPDLYDYDVYRTDFSGRILNNPIATWCIMAGGALSHPVPILKADSQWLTPYDLTTALTPAGSTTMEFRAYEFDRNKTVFYYRNPLNAGEQFWFWRDSWGVRNNAGQLIQPSFNRFAHPGEGLMIMHVDLGENPEALPLQQRLEGHFVYAIVQADGREDLESGTNGGDDGDPWPGSTNARVWNRGTDPDNRWYSGQGSGLDITNIQPLLNSTRVTFRWTPRELPNLEWIQPPGGVSVNSIYQLRYFAYDNYGGTTIEFYAFRNEPGVPLGYVGGIPVGTTTKTPGDVDGVYGANLSILPNGTYTFFAKLVPGVGADGNTENSFSQPRGNLNNGGDGTMTVTGVDLMVSKLERWTATCINAMPPGSETWRIEGTVSGVQVANAITGVPYQADAVTGPDGLPHSPVSFLIQPGVRPFRVNDTFAFLTTGLTPHSAAVLVVDGEVVEPQAPTADGRIESGSADGLAPHTVVFKHDRSVDAGGAAMTFTWDFGDGSPPFTTTQLDWPVSHTYTAPRAQPYAATLTVTNSFGLSAQDVVLVTVRDAVPPTIRATVDPTTGPKPLRVLFNATATSDPNTPPAQRLDFVWDFGDGTPVTTGATADHTFENAGVYRVVLSVTSRPYNKTTTRTFEIRATGPAANQPPIAVINANKRFGSAPLTVQFNADGSRDPEGGDLTYAWNFGDGSPIVRGVSSVEHTYTRARTFNATLTVTDNQNQSHSATIAIAVGADSTTNGAPVARIVASSTQGAVPFTVTFDARSSSDPENDPLSFAWDFGDGSAQEVGDVVTHTYTQAGRTYTVTLVARDTGSATGAATVSVRVTAPASEQPGLDQPDVLPELNACGGGAGCGPAGLMPMLLTLVGIGGLRRMRSRIIR